MEKKISVTVIESKARSPWMLLSHLISIVEGGGSHISLWYQDPFSEVPIVYQCNIFKAHFMKSSRFFETNQIVKMWQIDLSEGQFKLLHSFCWNNEGAEYSLMQLVGLGIVRLVQKLFKKTIKNPFSNGSHLQVCLETIGMGLVASKFMKAQDWDNMGIKEFTALMDTLAERK